jgi:hypothetical protein
MYHNPRLKVSAGFIVIMISVFITLHVSPEEKRTVELSAQEVAARVDAAMAYPDGKMTGIMVHKRPDGPGHDVQVVAVVNKTDYLFMVLSKTRGEEEKILYNYSGENIWVYDVISRKLFNKTFTGRHDLIIATNFNYDDISNVKFQGNFNAKLKGEQSIKGTPVILLELTPIYKRGVCYGSIIIFVRKDDYVPARIDYFDTSGVLEKRMYFLKTMKIGNRSFPVRCEMMNMKNGTITELNYLSFAQMQSFDVNLFNYKKLDQ